MADFRPIAQLLQTEPSPQIWAEAAEFIDATEGEEQKRVCKEIKLILRKWPKEIPRDPLDHWTPSNHSDLLSLCVHVDETATYGYYITNIQNAAELRLSNGKYGCRIQRFFSGAALSHTGNRWIKIGQKGQADLVGSLCIEFHGRIFPIYVELEIKMPKGRMNDAQKARKAMFERRGELYLCARSTKDAIAQLVEAKKRFEAL